MSVERGVAEWRAGWPTLANDQFWIEWESARERSRDAHVFHRADVLRAWYETVARAQDQEPVLISAMDVNGAPIRLAATVATYNGRWITRRVLEAAGQDLFGYHDPLVEGHADGIDWDAFWSEVRGLSDGADQALFRFVRASLAGRSMSEPAGDESPVLSLEGLVSLDDLLARCSANHRGDVRRRIRRAEEQGEVVLQVFAPSESSQAVSEFECRFWPAWCSASIQQGWGLHARPGFEAFCRRVVNEGLAAGWAQMAVLRVNGVPMAWHLGLCDAGRLYWWLPAHDQAHDALAPGKLLLALLVSHLISHGWRELHFQTGAQPYKLAWQPSVPPLAAVRWHAPSTRGRLLAAHDRLR